MNQEEKKLKIAVAIKIVSHDQIGPLFKTPHGYVRDCPDYFSDLNACHEMEKSLRSAQQCRDYADMLNDGNGGHFATAAQRAEALGLTLGLWE